MDEISLTLPISGSEVVIRNYTTRSDDSLAQAALTANVLTTPGDKKILYPAYNFTKYRESYTKSLVISIAANNKDIPTLLNNLRSEDYLAIETKVMEVVDTDSPKVKKGASA